MSADWVDALDSPTKAVDPIITSHAKPSKVSNWPAFGVLDPLEVLSDFEDLHIVFRCPVVSYIIVYGK